MDNWIIREFMLYEYLGSSVSETGIWFELRSFFGYVWESGIYVLFLVACIYLWKTKKNKIWVSPFVVGGLTIYNPILLMGIILLLEKTGILVGNALNYSYMRIFMLIPFHIIIVIAIMDLNNKIKAVGQRFIFGCMIIIALVFCGDTTLVDGYRIMENEYYVPDELIEICDVMHELSGKEEVDALVYHNTYRAYIRQYDASILIKDDYGTNSNIQDTDIEKLERQINDSDCEYVVALIDGEIAKYLLDMGYTAEYETRSCYIIKVG